MATPNLQQITQVAPALFFSDQLAAAGDTTVLVVSLDHSVQLKPLVLTNVSAASVVVSVSVVPSGGVAGTNNRIVNAATIGANNSLIVSDLDGFYLSDGDSIVVNVDTAAAVDAILSGLDFS